RDAGKQQPGGEDGRKNQRGDRGEHPEPRRLHQPGAGGDPLRPSANACTSTSTASSATDALTTKYPGLKVSGKASSSTTDCQTIGDALHRTNADPGTRIAIDAMRARRARSTAE